jgi:elongator complex protein 3
LLVNDTPEAMVKACADIISEMIDAVKSNKDVNLNGLKSRVARKHKLSTQPKLFDIIAAIPEQYKSLLLPKLRAKPIRTASGVSLVFACRFRNE